MAGLERLDDEDFPSVSMGQAAELLGVQPAFLRSLDTAGVLQPHRTGGGHRRYSRRQLAQAQRIRELLDAGHSISSARTIVELEKQVATSDAARRRADDARDQARRDRDHAIVERDHAAAERDRATEVQRQVVRERDTARSDLRERTDQLQRTQHELDQARDEINALQHELGHLGAADGGRALTVDR
ncbi:helix-turn-helix domain-containing protein [Pseudonocardia kujensis]|uniref:helix-turn-helix domain-containing protein n=1 Tax=Pseudonocardia kujensis TaxID=1128675 RepID=UPI0027E17E09|nr:helix-turn-helix domain-containing protein [Pseudonocardia kujensis]